MDYSEFSLRERYKIAAARLRYAEVQHYKADLDVDGPEDIAAANANRESFGKEIAKIKAHMADMDKQFRDKKLQKPDLTHISEGDLPSAIVSTAPHKAAPPPRTPST